MILPELQWHRHRLDAPWTYAALDVQQRSIASRVQMGGSGAVLLSELAPVITLGRKMGMNAPSHLFLPLERYEALGISIYPADRGGWATYHGPGQWVLFVVDALERLKGQRTAVREFVQDLLGIGQRSAQALGIQSEIRFGSELGLWTPQGKLASVGIRVERGVVLHGLSLNAYRTPISFMGIRPCGLDAQVAYCWDSEEEADFQGLGKILVQETLRVFWRVDAACSPRYTELHPFDTVGS